jgi:hypothetical protein
MTLAELVIKLSADTAVLRSDFEKGKRYAQDFAGDVSKIFKTIGEGLPGLSAIAVSKELFDVAESAAKAGDQIYKMAEITGLGAADLSGLRAISDESSESFESLGTTLARAGKNIEEGFIHPASGAGKLLAALFTPAELASLKLEPMSQRLQDVTKKVFGLTDASEKDFAAATIFGRGWMQNIETLQKLADEGFAGADAKATAFGITLGKDDVRAAHDFEEAMKTLGMVMKGWTQDAGLGFIHTITEGAQLVGNLRAGLEALKMPDWMRGGLSVLMPFPFLNMPHVPTVEPVPSHQAGGTSQSLEALIGAHGPSAGEKKIETELAHLQEELDSLTQGQSFKDLQELKSQGASPAELQKAQSILNQIDDYKYLTKALEGFDAADKLAREYAKEWGPTLTPLAKVMDDFAQRLEKIAAIEDKIGTSNAMALMQESASQASAEISKLSDNNPVLELQGFQANASLSRDAGVIQMPTVQAIQTLSQVHEKFAVLDADAYEFGEKASSAFTEMILHGSTLERSMRGLIDLFAQFLLKAVVFQQLSQAFGQGNSAGGVVGSLFAGLSHLAGFRAGGGDVNYGGAYLVGEQGPEIFTPTTSGMIIPNDQVGSGGGSRGGAPTYHIDARGADAGVEYRVMRAIAASQQKSTVNGYLMSQEMAKRGA